ncbi:hypothetical protein V8C42DRAFT_160966 [Trichoderma barbatum]
MLILQSTDTNLSEGLRKALSDIRELFEQVVCYTEDMEYALDRSDLTSFPMTLQPDPSIRVFSLFYHNKDVRDFLCTWADEKGFTIEFDGNYSGPQAIWLQGGAITLREDRISVLIILRRPKSRGADPKAVESVPSQEPLSKGIIERPICHQQFVRSSFQCQVGDVIVLEGGERLRARPEVDVQRDVCLLATLYSIWLKAHSLN